MAVTKVLLLQKQTKLEKANLRMTCIFVLFLLPTNTVKFLERQSFNVEAVVCLKRYVSLLSLVAQHSNLGLLDFLYSLQQYQNVKPYNAQNIPDVLYQVWTKANLNASACPITKVMANSVNVSSSQPKIALYFSFNQFRS